MLFNIRPADIVTRRRRINNTTRIAVITTISDPMAPAAVMANNTPSHYFFTPSRFNIIRIATANSPNIATKTSTKRS